MVHQHAKNQRRHRLANVQPAVDHAIDAARSIVWRGGLDQQVTRRPGHAGRKTHDAKQHRHQPNRVVAQRQQQCCRSGNAKGSPHNALAARRICCQKTA